MTTSTDTKIRENRARRAAERQGYVLRKSPRRDPRALDFNTWSVFGRDGVRLAGMLSLGDVEGFLRGER